MVSWNIQEYLLKIISGLFSKTLHFNASPYIGGKNLIFDIMGNNMPKCRSVKSI